MKYHCMWGKVIAISFAAMVGASIAAGQGQQPSPAPTPPGGGAGREPGGSTGRTPTTPTPTQPRIPEQERQRMPEMQRPIFLSGKVMLEDGTPPPEPVLIERVCNGTPRPEGYTDSKGRFSFQLGQNSMLIPDASVSSGNDPFASPGSPGAGGFGSTSSRSSPMGMDIRLMGCELRAALPGYRSDMVNLAGRRVMDNPDVGTIILRRLGNVEGTTISITSLQAPKDAKKAYEKGAEANKKRKWADAQKQLEKAVAEYPKYAAAWFELGFALQQQGNAEQAREAYAKSLEADPKFIKPYLQLALLAQNERKWQEVADTTDRAVRLNPVDFPMAFALNAIANLNLGNMDAAEKSAREAAKLDQGNRMPKIEHILGVVLANKGDFQGATEHIKNYLRLAPNASDADSVRKMLGDVEQRAAQAAAPAAQPRP